MSEKDLEKIEELTMLLLYLTSWKEEGYDYNEDGNISKQQFLGKAGKATRLMP